MYSVTLLLCYTAVCSICKQYVTVMGTREETEGCPDHVLLVSPSLWLYAVDPPELRALATPEWMLLPVYLHFFQVFLRHWVENTGRPTYRLTIFKPWPEAEVIPKCTHTVAVAITFQTSNDILTRLQNFLKSNLQTHNSLYTDCKDPTHSMLLCCSYAF